MKIAIATIVNADGESETGSALVDMGEGGMYDSEAAINEATELATERFNDQGYIGLKARLFVTVVDLPEPKMVATEVEFALSEQTGDRSDVSIHIHD